MSTVSPRLRTTRYGLMLAASALSLCAAAAEAQSASTASPGAPGATAASDQGAQVSEIVVTGLRATQRSSIQTKRTATTIVDAISADQIGALPDNSIAETLERVVGVTGDRFKGSASELSIRGLGPFLGFATINGRDISTGGGNRSVSFQQFPSELTKGVVVYKAQEADLVEGGVAGTVNLLTGSPLDYHGRHLDMTFKEQLDPYAAKFKGDSGLGYRGSVSYMDQFDTAIGQIGVLAGYFRSRDRVPEDFYTTSSSWRPCNTLQLAPSTSTANCAVAAAPSKTTILADPVYYVSNTYNYRELATMENRESFMGSVEWRASPDFRMKGDYEISTRDDIEGWHDMVLLDGRRGVGAAVIEPNGVLDSWSGNSRVGAQTRQRDRWERYRGGGLSADWTPGAWTVHADLSDSYSHRTQLDQSAAVATATYIPYTVQTAGRDIPLLTFGAGFDPSNFLAYNSTTGANYSSNATDYVDEIKAALVDVSRKFDSGFITSVKGGVRYAERDHVSYSASTGSTSVTSASLINTALNSCHVPFEESGWGEDAQGGGAQPSSWATFEPLCMYHTLSNNAATGGVVARDPGNVNVTEKTLAGYVMASFAAEAAPVPFSGNLGVRVIRTQEDVKGWSAALHATTTPDGFIQLTADTVNLQPVSAGNHFVDVLPSLNLTFDLRDDLSLRVAVYKALSRPNMEEMSAGRSFTTLSGEATSVQEALASASGGNPHLQPLRAWNYDLSLEWYPDPYTVVAFAPYYKVLKAAYTVSTLNSNPETVYVDGTPYTVNVAQLANSDDKSWLRGFEVTAQHAFKELPGLLSGFGVQLSYSYAESNYKFPDPSAVDPSHPLALYTDPAGVIGLSKNVASSTVYWSNDKLEVRASYRYRSGYFKPLEPTGAAANRYIDSGSFVDASIRYRVTKHLDVQLQGSNLTNEPQVMYRPVVGEVAQTEYSGPTFLLGVHFHY